MNFFFTHSQFCHKFAILRINSLYFYLPEKKPTGAKGSLQNQTQHFRKFTLKRKPA